MNEMQRYISQLNEAQQLPVLQKDGPMIVIAGAYRDWETDRKSVV